MPGLFLPNHDGSPCPYPLLRRSEIQRISIHFRLSAQFGNMTHFCPVRWEGRLAGRFLERASCHWRQPWKTPPPTPLSSVTPGPASRKGRVGQGPQRVALERGREGPADLTWLLPQPQCGVQEQSSGAKGPGRAHVETPCVSTLHVAGFPSRFFPNLLWRSSTVLLSQEMCASPLKSNQLSALFQSDRSPNKYFQI